MPGYAEHVNWVFGGKDIEETLKIVRQMTLEGVADKIRVRSSSSTARTIVKCRSGMRSARTMPP